MSFILAGRGSTNTKENENEGKRMYPHPLLIPLNSRPGESFVKVPYFYWKLEIFTLYKEKKKKDFGKKEKDKTSTIPSTDIRYGQYVCLNLPK